MFQSRGAALIPVSGRAQQRSPHQSHVKTNDIWYLGATWSEVALQGQEYQVGIVSKTIEDGLPCQRLFQCPKKYQYHLQLYIGKLSTFSEKEWFSAWLTGF